MYQKTNIENGIAIIGMSGQFPGAADIHEFWKNLCEGRESLRELSREEVNSSLSGCDPLSMVHMRKQITSGTWVDKAFAMDDMDKFDAEFFGYTPSDAELLDPQQRLFLQSCWAALEDAGYIPDDVKSVVGVFGGTGLSRYFLNNVFSNREIMFSSRDLTAGIGNEPDYLSNRVAFKLNLNGPSVTVQTACSTSLVAIHMASQSLLAGECDMCLAGGSMVTVPHSIGYMYQEGSMSSPDGHIRAFDAKAQGTVFADGGVGVVCLKRLEDAIADEDPIYAVILGSAVSNDGNIKAGYTAPGIDGQVKVISEALQVARVNPEDIHYLEAHGTGTPLGDPIEITSLSKAYRRYTDNKQYCAVGSLKPNVGHLAPVAGVASVIKAALTAQQGLIPPSINYEEPNPKIDFPNTPFFVNDKLTKWDEQERICAVSSFGIGGTNSHLILCQPPRWVDTQPSQHNSLPYFFPVSTRHPEGVNEYQDKIYNWAKDQADLSLANLATSLQEGRKTFTYRRLVAAKTPVELLHQLKLAQEPVKPALDTPKTCWMFSGQGSQYLAMGSELYERLDVFRRHFDLCADLLKTSLGQDIRQLLKGDDAEQINQTAIAQPLVFSFEYALAMQLEDWGLAADAMIGHSLGEYVAATLAGVFRLEDALNLIATRGRLMQSMPRGSMLSVPLSQAQVQEFIDKDVALAAVNTDTACVLAGPTPALEALQTQLEARNIPGRLLQTSHAFHSPMMSPIAQELAEALRRSNPQAPQRPYISNVTGTWITAEQAQDPAYWTQHLLSEVRFAAGINTLVADGFNVFLEVGPGKTLATFARRALAGRKAERVIELVRHPKEETGDMAFLTSALGQLWNAGIDLAWDKLNPARGRRISLPTYPFKRDSFWIAPGKSAAGTLSKQPDMADWFWSPSWKSVRTDNYPAIAWSGKRVLCFSRETPLEQSLLKKLEAAGAEVIHVLEGSSFTRQSERAYALPAGDEASIETLAKQVQHPDVIIYDWLLDDARYPLDVVEQGLKLSFFTPMYLVRQFGLEPVTYLSLSTGLSAPLPDDQLDATKAAHLGIHLSAGFEYDSFNSLNIDIDQDKLQQAEFANLILRELNNLLQAPGPLLLATEKCVALRGNRRWQMQPEANRLVSQQAIKVDAEGLYVISGGLGGLGLTFANYLAKKGAKHLLLLGRTEFPAESEWDALTGKQARQVTELRNLQKLGCKVHLGVCDITNAEQIQTCIKAASNLPVRGIIHSAGIAGDGVIQMKEAAQANAVLLPKIKGALALELATQGQPLDFYLLFSSLFAIVGGVGQVDYCAANNMLDSFAMAARQRGLPVTSIGWGGWRDVGMAVDKGMVKASAPTPLPEGKNLPHPYLFSQIQNSNHDASYQCHWREADLWALEEHRIQGQATMPGTGLIEAVRAAFCNFSNTSQVEFSNLYFFRPLMLADGECANLHIHFDRDGDGFSFSLQRGQKADDVFLRGQIRAIDTAVPSVKPEDLHGRYQAGHKEFAEGDTGLLLADPEFLQLGARWQLLKEIHFGDQALLGKLSLANSLRSDIADFGLHPGLLDMATGPSSGHLLERLPFQLEGEYLPFSYGNMKVLAPLTADILSEMRFTGRDEESETLTLDINLYDSEGKLLVEIRDFTLKQVPANAFNSAPQVTDLLDDSISPSEGVAALERILAAGNESHWILCPQPLDMMLEGMKAAHLEKLQARQQASVRSSSIDVVAAETPLQQQLIDIYQAVLGISPIGINDNYFELGGDSVLGIQIVSHAKGQGIQLKPGDLFKYPNIRELATFLATSFPELAQSIRQESSLNFQQALWLPQDAYIRQTLVFDAPLATADLNRQLENLRQVLPLVALTAEDGQWKALDALSYQTLTTQTWENPSLQPGSLFSLFALEENGRISAIQWYAHVLLGLDAQQWHEVGEWLVASVGTTSHQPPAFTGTVMDKETLFAMANLDVSTATTQFQKEMAALVSHTPSADIAQQQLQIRLPGAADLAHQLGASNLQVIASLLGNHYIALMVYQFNQNSGLGSFHAHPVMLAETELAARWQYLQNPELWTKARAGNFALVAEQFPSLWCGPALLDAGMTTADTQVVINSSPHDLLIRIAHSDADLVLDCLFNQAQAAVVAELARTLPEECNRLESQISQSSPTYATSDIGEDDLAILLDLLGTDK